MSAPSNASDESATRAGDDLGFALPAATKVGRTRAGALIATALVVVGAAFLLGYLPKQRARAVLEESSRRAEGALVRVSVIKPKLAARAGAIVLPGSVQALQETVVYSRANGYVRRWLADIGDKVKEGQLLAELDTPELDQELVAARAQLAQAQASILQSKANRDFARTSLERVKRLVPAGVTSQQEFEQAQAQEAVAEANLSVSQANAGAQQANIERLSKLKSFARVLAPFGGVITLRSIDRGALVTAGNATPLYKIATMDPVRVLLQIPQNVAPSIRTHLPAKVTVREYPNRVFEADVTRSAGALDPSLRTMTTEIRMPNPKGELLAGMYAEVSISLPSPHQVFEVPATSLLSDAKGMRLVIVDADNRAHIQPVVVERDTGAMVQLATGLQGDERIVKLATAEIQDGQSLDVAP
ncbi:MAG TPA: efflux RND transporter periplasmic adaptor subunit [Polyangia bacterium]|nr:efflux RND transporter periplasmic adaptor subunit [Polyangia bacterium]